MGPAAEWRDPRTAWLQQFRTPPGQSWHAVQPVNQHRPVSRTVATRGGPVRLAAGFWNTPGPSPDWPQLSANAPERRVPRISPLLPDIISMIVISQFNISENDRLSRIRHLRLALFPCPVRVEPCGRAGGPCVAVRYLLRRHGAGVLLPDIRVGPKNPASARLAAHAEDDRIPRPASARRAAGIRNAHHRPESSICRRGRECSGVRRSLLVVTWTAADSCVCLPTANPGRRASGQWSSWRTRRQATGEPAP